MTDYSFPFGGLFDALGDPVLCVKDSTVVYMNPAAIKWFDAQPGASVFRLLPEQITSETEESFVASAVIRHTDVTVSCGTYEAFRLYNIIIPNQGEEQTGKNALSVSLRDLGNTIKATVDQIQALTGQYDNEKLNRYVLILKHSTYKLKRILLNEAAVNADERNAYSRKFSTISINNFCEETVAAVADLAAKKGIHVDFTAKDNVISAVEPFLLQQMLLNLLCNSLEHTAPGGHIHVSLRADAHFFSISVADDGCGIPPEQLSTLFHQYQGPIDPMSGQFTAGLGLGAADAIAKRHGGSIIVHSVPGKGTTVIARIERKRSKYFESPTTKFLSDLPEAIITGLSPWLNWEDYKNI